MGVVVFADAKVLDSQDVGPMNPVVNLITQKIPDIDLNSFTEQQLVRMKEMTGGKITVDRNAKMGELAAHRAVSVLNLPGASFKFFALWSYHNGVGYSFFFHSPAKDFDKFGTTLTHMIKTFEPLKLLPQSYPLETYCDNGFVFRYPASWKVQSKSDGADKSPLVVLNHESTSDGEKQSITMRVLATTKKGSLSTHIDLLKVQLEKMHVEDVELVTTKVGSKDARVATWISEASGSPMRYIHMITTENDDEKTPVISMTLSTNTLKSEHDQVPTIFRQIRSSFAFLSESEDIRRTSEWLGFYHLRFGFAFLYDGKHYLHRAEGIPLTEASFCRVGDDPVNPLVNFSVIVRELTPGETPDLEAMGDELKENLKGVCGNSLQQISNSPVTLCGLPARVLIFHGTASSPVNPSEMEEMYFVYKYVINQ